MFGGNLTVTPTPAQAQSKSILNCELSQKYCYPRWGVNRAEKIRCARSDCYRGWNGQNHEQDDTGRSSKEVAAAVSDCRAGTQTQAAEPGAEFLGYHRKAAIRSLRAPTISVVREIITGRPVTYPPGLLLPHLRPIWQATDYACGQRLVAMLPEWIPAYEQHERKLPGEVRDKLLEASGRTLDRLWRRCASRVGGGV